VPQNGKAGKVTAKDVVAAVKTRKPRAPKA
jgi:hypothetical protein